MISHFLHNETGTNWLAAIQALRFRLLSNVFEIVFLPSIMGVTMIDWLKHLFGDLHNFAASTGLVVSLLGAVLGGSVKTLSNWATRRRQPEIKAESEKNFQTISFGETYTIDGKGNIVNSAKSESLSSSHRTSNQGRAHSGNWNTSGTLGASETETISEGINKGRFRTTDSAENLHKLFATTKARDQVRKRLEEIIEERERQQSTAKWSRFTSQTITFGQYIVGAMLTTSLAQLTVSKTWLSVFGLIVILCSATKQHFHIDENAQSSDARYKKLRSLVRYAQDQIAILEIRSVKGEDRTDAYISLLTEITQSLSAIESPDAPYLPKETAATETNT